MRRLLPVAVAASLLLLSSEASPRDSQQGRAAPERSFVVVQDAFLLNGSPITIRSGSFHYHRCVPEQWEDRLRRMAAMGLNAVQTYVPWNWHELTEGEFDFSGPRDLEAFLKLSQRLGFLVLLRAGPYICGEHDLGGLPAYLLTRPGIQLRTNDTAYLAAVDRWWGALLPRVAPLTVAQGGPVAMVQIENEFGSYGSTGHSPADRAYVEHLKELAYAHLGGPAPKGIQLYTTDGGSVSYMTGGALGGEVFATGDWGPDTNVDPHFAAEDAFNPAGSRAHTNSEYYTGWLTHWGEAMANTSSASVVAGLAAILAKKGSFNLYMAYGGTNWGFWNGANGGGTSFQPVITSYDYDSPIAEGGGHGYGPDGDKYTAVRQLLTYWSSGEALLEEPPAPAVASYGRVRLTAAAGLWPNLRALAVAPSFGAAAPATMEVHGQSRGYILYRTRLPAGRDGQDTPLVVAGLADRGEVFVNGISVGVTYRPDADAGHYTIPGVHMLAGATLDILVENMGHINYGHGFFDPKGITGDVLLNGAPLKGNWSSYPLPFNYDSGVSALPFVPHVGTLDGPSFLKGTFTVEGAPKDTYMTLCGWSKGTMWINGFHLGRYWEEKGPQHSFYVPAPILKTGSNEVIVFEQHSTNADQSVSFVDVPDFTGAVCQASNGTPPPASPPVGLTHQGEPAALIRVLRGTSCRAPAAGLPVAAVNCAATPSATEWTWTPVAAEVARAGVLRLASRPDLCATAADAADAADADVRSGEAAPGTEHLQPVQVVLRTCHPALADRAQHFLALSGLAGEPLLALGGPGAGQCVGVAHTDASSKLRLELATCDGSERQAWRRRGSLLQCRLSDVCAAAC